MRKTHRSQASRGQPGVSVAGALSGALGEKARKVGCDLVDYGGLEATSGVELGGR